MKISESIINYRRHLKRRNCSSNTVKNYLNILKHFVLWLNVPLEKADRYTISAYIDYLQDRRLEAKTINCHLTAVRCFYNFLKDEEELNIINPVGRGRSLRLGQPLPKHLRDQEVITLFNAIKNRRDRTMFMLMLRCGLRVAEVADLTLDAVDLKHSRLYVNNGKGGKGRVVYLSRDATHSLAAYLQIRRPLVKTKKVFLVEKGRCRGKPVSMRGIQKRIEHYAEECGLDVSCHQLRHTMATQLLNADADLVTIQDLLGHTRIKTTQRYCRVSNLKVQKDYLKAMETVMGNTARGKTG
jgi:site-specific recombinase XerD